MIRYFLKEVPIPTAGLALGVVAIGKLIGPYSSYLEIACATISIFLIALVTSKALFTEKHSRMTCTNLFKQRYLERFS